MRKGKLWRALAIAALLWTLVVPAMAEEVQEPIPYPKRTILYIVDCSGSMETYQEVLKSGRQPCPRKCGSSARQCPPSVS